jgi:hypothetical protein
VDWTERYPAIAAAPAKLRARSFTIDGEAMVTGPDGIAVFDALHRRRRDGCCASRLIVVGPVIGPLDGPVVTLPTGHVERPHPFARLLPSVIGSNGSRLATIRIDLLASIVICVTLIFHRRR